MIVCVNKINLCRLRTNIMHSAYFYKIRQLAKTWCQRLSLYQYDSCLVLCFQLWFIRIDIITSSVFWTDWAPSSEFVSSSIPSWQTLTAHAQPFREARDLAFCLKVLLDALFVWASSKGFGEAARMRRIAWTFDARIDDKYQIRLTRSRLIPSLCIVFIIFVIQQKLRARLESRKIGLSPPVF